MSKTTGHQTEHHPRHRLLEALRGFSSYAKTQLASIDRLQGLYSHASVSRHQKRLLERTVGYSSKFASVRDRILKNQRLCHAIVLDALDFYRIDQAELDTHAQQMEVAGRAVDKVSVSQALKHIVRDWAAEGASERDAAFPCIIEALRDLSSSSSSSSSSGHNSDLAGNVKVKVLLPGAGLGRLGHEVAEKLNHGDTGN